jgi:hypothetical protein
MTTASDEMRECLLDALPKSQHRKIDAIMSTFDRLLSDATMPERVWVEGARPAVEYVEAYGLEIGVDACGNAETVTPIGVGWPQGFALDEMIYG